MKIFKKTTEPSCQPITLWMKTSTKLHIFISKTVTLRVSYSDYTRRNMSRKEFSGPLEYLLTFYKHSLPEQIFTKNTKHEGNEKLDCWRISLSEYLHSTFTI